MILDRWARGDALIQAPPELEELVKSTWQAWRSWGVDLEEKGPKRGEECSVVDTFPGAVLRCPENAFVFSTDAPHFGRVGMAWNGMRLGPSHDEHSNSIELHCVESSCRLKQQLSAA